MSTPGREENLALALRYLRHLADGEHEAAFALASASAVFFLPGVGETNVDEVRKILGQARTRFAGQPEFRLRSVTVEGNRVAVEYTNDIPLRGGGHYRNDYHFLFVVEAGQLVELREYADSVPGTTFLFSPR